MFTNKLAALASAAVDFRYGIKITGILHDGRQATGVATSEGVIKADAARRFPRLAVVQGTDTPKS